MPLLRNIIYFIVDTCKLITNIERARKLGLSSWYFKLTYLCNKDVNLMVKHLNHKYVTCCGNLFFFRVNRYDTGLPIWKFPHICFSRVGKNTLWKKRKREMTLKREREGNLVIYFLLMEHCVEMLVILVKPTGLLCCTLVNNVFWILCFYWIFVRKIELTVLAIKPHILCCCRHNVPKYCWMAQVSQI